MQTNITVLCPRCPGSITPFSLDELKEHAAKEHLEMTPLYNCPQCQAGFVSSHMALHHFHSVCCLQQHYLTSAFTNNLLCVNLSVFQELNQIESEAIRRLLSSVPVQAVLPYTSIQLVKECPLTTEQAEFNGRAQSEIEILPPTMQQNADSAEKPLEEANLWPRIKNSMKRVAPSDSGPAVPKKKRVKNGRRTVANHACEYMTCCEPQCRSICDFCNGLHRNQNCATVVDFEERKMILRSKGICTSCGVRHQSRVEPCRIVKCKHCSSPHPEYFCLSSNYHTRLEMFISQKKYPPSIESRKLQVERSIICNAERQKELHGQMEKHIDVGSLAPDSQPSQGPSCSCQYDKVWVDLMILIESSESIGDMGLQEIFGYVQTSLNWFNIQLANSTDPFHTRIGLIIYDAEPKLLASLGTMTGDQLQNFGEVEYLGGDTTSIDKSMAMAFKEFDGPNRRKNARKMIALFATSFNTMSDDALDRARNFEEDDGIMYVYNFVEEDSIPRPELKELATTGYFWDYSNDYRGEGFMVSLCNSNCYCMDDYSSFEDNPVDGTPKAGCYYSVNTQSNFRLAISRCQRYNNGSIAQGKTQEKANFLQSQFEFSNARFWAGITWNAADNSYMWMDGTPIGNETYQPWGASRVSGQDCVAIMNNLWMPMDCRVGYEYICEAAPCDSQHYCEDEED